jgi:hypothetical protein
MGFLEDLIKSVQEAEAQRRGQRPPASMPQPEAQVLRVRRARPAPPPEPEPEAPERTRIETAPPVAPVAQQTAEENQANVRRQFARLLRQPRTVRTAIVLSELLQPPLALRRGLIRSRFTRPS